ncbi:hypothetical protein G3580_05245 [Nitrogeniibacter mangrovi]|uniref:Tryptophan synthase subunit beta like protein n=1 Tax=Nitrogeniibacter mangrovi TaxID=2016596 RepID=A0A6C1B0K1_9RHOO|nr:hypothetical protein [Nitrogeniibacter mangrovi]QID17097.1 hypothetical protein G3580_05245 [Nitrogeniibacter mangrovi]
MVFVKRDAQGQVVSASLAPDAEHTEPGEPGDPAVAAFARNLLGDDAMVDSDLRLVRVLEDVIDLLISRDVIRFTDLPPPAQAKLMERRSMRQSRGTLDLLGGDDLV